MTELRVMTKSCPKCGLVQMFDVDILANPLGPNLTPIWGRCPNCGDESVFAKAGPWLVLRQEQPHD